MKFKVGDVVELISGGPPMTIIALSKSDDDTEIAACGWFIRGKYERTNFDLNTLKFCEDD